MRLLFIGNKEGYAMKDNVGRTVVSVDFVESRCDGAGIVEAASVMPAPVWMAVIAEGASEMEDSVTRMRQWRRDSLFHARTRFIGQD
ncbi:hypothetical protein A2482_00250 [Candidatus Falkowbacteria bacterium RIFOXYC2_FULL_48_21]|uniref:Uncharacterized protein n=1 Tax=Candidatus Falkowbacteria bacterium RIFOXYC2_FULL_48_21 TaxID=1798005 RepID=A0A1F5TCU3_9BACT|nr:MAG: hypothetical protein A2482_00250 [Candidatus Falkowbacteria bacterium RIFOXYC2_FULL_48_21]